MRIYFSIWLGEVASTVGSALTSFALGIWIYEQTESVSLFTLNVLAYVVPGLLLAPIAGVIADRWNRKWVIVLGDAGVALTTLCVFLLATGGHLRIGHIYLLTALQFGVRIAAMARLRCHDPADRAERTPGTRQRALAGRGRAGRNGRASHCRQPVRDERRRTARDSAD